MGKCQIAGKRWAGVRKLRKARRSDESEKSLALAAFALPLESRRERRWKTGAPGDSARRRREIPRWKEKSTQSARRSTFLMDATSSGAQAVEAAELPALLQRGAHAAQLLPEHEGKAGHQALQLPRRHLTSTQIVAFCSACASLGVRGGACEQT